MKTASTPPAPPSTEVGEFGGNKRTESRPPVGEGDEERTGSRERIRDAREPHLLRVPRPPADDRNTPPGAGEDWFGEDDPANTLEWPALTRREPRERKRGSGSRPQPGHASNVRNLFPEPETTEWSIDSHLQLRREEREAMEPHARDPERGEGWEEEPEDAPYEPRPMEAAVQASFEVPAEEPEDDDADYWSAPV